MSPILGLILIMILLPVAYLMYISGKKGAPFVPTNMKACHKMLELCNIKYGELLVDPGAGDGRFIRLASSKYKAKAIGLELSPPIYLYGKIINWLQKSNAKYCFGDSRHFDFEKVDVVALYLLPEPLKNFWQKKLEKELPKHARVVSYAFEIGNWKITKEIQANKKLNIAPIYYYEMDKI